MTILIIAAHPDDEILGCGGTVARMAKDGQDAHAVILGEGIASRYEKRTEAMEKEIRKLHNMSQEATKIIGIMKTIWHNLPDNRFDSVPLLDIVKTIENEIDTIEPDIIFTHHGGDLNIDHVLTYRAVLTAARPIGKKAVKDIYCFQIPSSTEWAFQSFDPSWKPNTFFDISDTLEVKLRALQAYEGEMREFPHPRSLKNVSDMASVWGATTGTKAAEAFELVRSIK